MAPRPQPTSRPSGQTPASKVAEDALKRKKALEAWGTPQPSAFHQANQRDANLVRQSQIKKALHDAENTKTPGHNPDSAHFSKKFPCTYAGCGRRFDDKKGLVRHKDSEHDYCKVCDEDFKDEDALHLHKMQSEKHVVCNICGVEFMSELGRDRHAKQMHSAQQNIECRGCHKVFAKGSGLLLHFEQNACKPLQSIYMADRQIPGREMLESNRALLALQMEQLQEEEKAKKAAARSAKSVAHSVVSGSEGGVPLEPSLLDMPTRRDFGTTGDAGEINEFENLIELASGSKDGLQAPLIPKSIYDSGMSAASGSTTRALLGNYPVLKPQVKGKGKENEEVLIQGIDTMSIAGSSKSSMPGAWGNAAQKLFPNAQPTPVPADLNLENLKGIKLGEDAAEAQFGQLPGTVMQVDPMDGKFHCPFPTCEEKADDMYGMIDHMQAHKGIANRCSSCFRIFGSASALVAHMESPSTRCNIRSTKGYSNAIHIVSGGFLGAYGMNEDGTVKLDSQKKPESFW